MTRDVYAHRRRCLSLAGWGLAGFGLTAALAGCGFQPIYMPTASGKPGVAQRELASVEVAIIAERPGQELRQALQRRFGSDAGTTPSYVLRVVYTTAGEALGIDTTLSGIATRVRMTGSAAWTLTSHDPTPKTLTTGSARAIDGLNVFDEQYFASDLETEAVQQRLSEALAQQIATQLAIWFREQAAKSS